MATDTTQVFNIVNQTEAAAAQAEGEFTSSNGVRFQLIKVSRLLIMDAVKNISEPKVPVVFIEEKGRTEPNPSDPDYLAAVQNFNLTRALLVSTLTISLGSRVLSLPEAYNTVDDTEWSTDLADFGVLVPAKGKARYGAWLKYYILSDEDIGALVTAIMRYSGTTIEADAQAAQASFPSN